MESNQNTKISRWLSIPISLIVILIVILSILKLSKTKSPALTIVTWGGSYQETERKAFFKPFSESSKIIVNEGSYSGEYSKIENMVQSKNVTWDVVEVETPFVLKGIDSSYFEPLNFNVINKELFNPTAVNNYSIAVECWAVILAWNTEKVGNKQPPKTWADLWDLKKYPGKRGFDKRPQYTLEVALLADGVDPDSLYPIDVDRALRKLNKIKDNILWWSSGSQMQQLLKTDVIMAQAWNGRVWSLKRDGYPIDYSMNRGILDWTWWVVPKGSKKVDYAMLFLKSTARKEAGQLIMIEHGYGSPLRDFELPSTINTKYIPLGTKDQNLINFNAEWWYKNEINVMKKWEKWMSE
jgi:putative spermidine/putrescine transport system substrate-binding protein